MMQEIDNRKFSEQSPSEARKYPPRSKVIHSFQLIYRLKNETDEADQEDQDVQQQASGERSLQEKDISLNTDQEN